MGLSLLAWLLLASGLISSSMGARILGVFPFPARSHVVIYSTLLQELAARGHDVTVYSAYPLDTPVPNYTDIKLNLSLSAIFGNEGTKKLFTMGKINSFVSIIGMHFGPSAIEEQAFQLKEIQELISSTDKNFDLIFLPDFNMEAFSGLAHKFDVPIIYMSPTSGFPWTNDLVGSPSPDSYVPSILSKHTNHMIFRQRLENAVINHFCRLFHQLYHIPSQDRVMRKYFRDIDDLPHLSEINRRTALVFVYGVPGINYPQPLLPNIIQVGGMHVKPPKPLPKDLMKFLDDAKEGVIYFSMGSNVRSAEFPEDKRSAFVKAFAKLKQKILWKFEEENLPGQPENLKINKWFPQNDILAHKNVVLFITHGGALSTQEAVYHGVPFIGIPIFGDQDYVVNLFEHHGCGLKLEFPDINEASVERVVKEAITNPSYRERANQLSNILHDQPQSPLERGVFWTEYVLRHNGAPHLRSAAMDLSWYQYLLLDVVALLVLVPAALAYCVLLLCRTLSCGTNKLSANPRKKKQ